MERITTLALFVAAIAATDLNAQTSGKMDFTPGDRVIFFDSLKNEQVGEFPSKWDLVKGSMEVTEFEGAPAIAWASNQAAIKPLMKSASYLPEWFTLEFEAYFHYKGNEGYYLKLQGTPAIEIRVNIDYIQYKGENSSRSQKTGHTPGWREVALSFNKRALKIYLNGERLVNVPNVTEQPKWMEINALNHSGPQGFPAMIRNVRLAEGGMPLYDRLITDGRFATYGITFDVNKTEIKPASQPVLDEIAAMLKAHPELRVSVEGHTDGDGADDANMKLSQGRAAAVKAELVKAGVAADRLEARGWGETKPVAGNDTPEDKARNRRVEVVQLK
ncbi:MAG: OmpA family protein [Flavobacteriales bacterium]|nr:OmpA family protein [Flavobacteriales bacterium]